MTDSRRTSGTAPALRGGASSLATTGLMLSGLALIFIGQRIMGVGTLHDAATYGGLALVAFAVGLRIAAFAPATGDVRGVQGRLLAAYAGCCTSLLLYALSTDAGIQKLGLTGDAAVHATGALSVLWPAVLLVSLIAVLFMELVFVRMPIAESVELRRVQTSLHAGLTLGLSVVFLLSINYVATARDVRKDVSYFRTTQPSDASRALVAKLDKPLRVLLLFRQSSDVLAQVEPYFAALAQTNKKFTYQVVDYALAPELATKYQIRDNGNVLLFRAKDEAKPTDAKPAAAKSADPKKIDDKGEAFHVGNELTEARTTLRKLDGMFQQSFAKLVRPERILYLTVGHGERNAKSSELQSEDGTSLMNDLLRQLNLRTRDLGLTQGLGNAVPSEASAVLVIGPTEKFLPEEAAALLAYTRQGGKLFLMLEPDKDVGLGPLLDGLGVQLLPGTVNSDNFHMARNHNQSDRGIVFSNHYTSHPAVTTVSRHQRDVATVFVNAAALAPAAASPAVKLEPKPRVTFPLHSDREFWRDLNGNFTHDDAEPIEQVNLMAAVTVAAVAAPKADAPKADAPKPDAAKPDAAKPDATEGRVVLLGDGDFITNKVAPNRGNVLLFVDSLAWLVGNEDLSGDTNSEEDVAIEHSREQDKAWFYATTFAVPVPIVFGGTWIARRRRRRAETGS